MGTIHGLERFMYVMSTLPAGRCTCYGNNGLGEGRGCRELAQASRNWQKLGERRGCRELARASRKWQELLRLRTNTVRTEHRTLYKSPNVRTTPITTLRFSKVYHHCGNVNTYTLYYTYICSRLCTLGTY